MSRCRVAGLWTVPEGQAGDGGVTMESGERSVEFHKWLELVTDMIATPGDLREEGGMAAKARSRMNKKLTRVNVDKRWREVVTGVHCIRCQRV